MRDCEGHVSSKLAVATSPCSSQRPCVSRKFAASCLLSSRSSASISKGVTKSASLSRTANMTDRAQRRLTDLPDAFSNRVRSAEDLVALLVQEQMVVAKMRTRHVPVKILGLQV